MSATAICSTTFSLSRMASAPKSANDSAQSPACSRNARPWATSPRAAVSWRASPATTSGGRAASCASTRFSASSSGQRGLLAGRALPPRRGVPGVHGTSVGRRRVGGALAGCRAPERLGLLGGTFDPPHEGHLDAARRCRDALGLDRVLLVVANDPWQKAPATPAADRYAMVEAAVEGVDRVEASRLEIDRGGPSYTVDTVERCSPRGRPAPRALRSWWGPTWCRTSAPGTGWTTCAGW